jgi:hypothetical protein
MFMTCENYFKHLFNNSRPGLCSQYNNSLWAGQSGDWIPVGARFSTPIQTSRRAHPVYYTMGKKVKESHNRSGVAQRVPGGLGSQISVTFGTWRWWGQPHAPAAFTPRKCSWYSFSLGAELTRRPWYDWKENVTEKSSDTTGNQSQDCPTSSTALWPLCYPRPHCTVGTRSISKG